MTREDKRSYFCISVILTFLVLLTIQSFHNDDPAMASDQLGPPGSFSSSYSVIPQDNRRARRDTLMADTDAADSAPAPASRNFD